MDGNKGCDFDRFVSRLDLVAGLLFAAVAWGLKWDIAAFRVIAHLFYEQSPLAALREPSQCTLVHNLLLGWLGFPLVLAVAWKRFSPHARRCTTLMALAYAVRAAIWITGSNLPLVSGDSCHYVEVASSILRGEGPVKHYADSFFRDYPAIRRNEGVLDDWSTPLYPYLLAGAYRACGVTPGDSLETTFAVAKGLSFLLNLATLPVFYYLVRRSFGPDLALRSMAILTVFPVHTLYAGMELRESLVMLTTLAAVGSFIEMTRSSGTGAAWAVAAGLFTGLAILSRNTAMVVAAACCLYGLLTLRGRRVFSLIVWAGVAAIVILPWALATYREYGQAFYSYAQYFAYNFSWTVHLYEQGNTKPSQFFTSANAPAIALAKFKSFLIVVVYSTMIVSVPLAVGFIRRLWGGTNSWDRITALVALGFLAGTLVGTADVTQVIQLGRYYAPLFVLMIPSAVAGSDGLLPVQGASRRLVGLTVVALLWADPTWAYDFTWLSKGYQLHWPALQQAGDWVRSHPSEVPEDSRIVTWFPWEFRLASRRTTILMNRSLYAPHIERTIRQYEATQVLWGSFEAPPDVDPELWGATLTQVRTSLELAPSKELYRSPTNLYPVTLYTKIKQLEPTAGPANRRERLNAIDRHAEGGPGKPIARHAKCR